MSAAHGEDPACSVGDDGEDESAGDQVWDCGVEDDDSDGGGDDEGVDLDVVGGEDPAGLEVDFAGANLVQDDDCLLYTSPSPRDRG